MKRPFGGVFLCLRIITTTNILPKRNLFIKYQLPNWIKAIRQNCRAWKNGFSGVFLQGNTMRKLLLMTAIAGAMAMPAFAHTFSAPSPETITGGSSSSVSSTPYGASENSYAGSASNIGIQNDKFTSWNTDKTTTNVYPVDGNGTYVTDISKTTTTTTGTAALEGGGTQSYGGETGGAYYTASGYESGSLSVDPNAGGFPPQHP